MRRYICLGICLALLVMGACIRMRADQRSPTGYGGSGLTSATTPELQDIMAKRFADLHEAYLAADGARYTPLLRATLRHARRLEPAQCVALQGQLIELGNRVGYDGLEPLWLVYQDCAAAGDPKALGRLRLENAERLRAGLRFARDPLSQLPLRVTHWNSTLERGVRGDAVRAVMQQLARQKPAAIQGLNLHQMLRLPAARAAICGVPARTDQHGQVAISDLVRVAACLFDSGLEPRDVCATLSARAGTGRAGGMSDQDQRRLQDLCNDLGGSGEASAAGMDPLDAASTDQCNSEDKTKAYDTEKIAQLVEDCYLGGQGNPAAIGGTTANYDWFLNVPVSFKIDDHTYGASFISGASLDDPSRDITLGYGDSPDQAMKNLLNQLTQNPPPGSTVQKSEDGTVTVEKKEDVQNPDGTTTHVTETTAINPDGSVDRTVEGQNSDGSGDKSVTHVNPDGSSTSTKITYDQNGNTTRTEDTKTDADGNWEKTTTDRQFNEDGEVTNSVTTTTHGTEESEGGFDPHNPACQQLMALEVIPGMDRTKAWDDLFNRPYRKDPRTIHPTPDQAGTSGRGSPTVARRGSAAMTPRPSVGRPSTAKRAGTWTTRASAGSPGVVPSR